MNPFKSWPVFAATVYTTILTMPSWWAEWWIYLPNWLVVLSWLVAPWLWIPDGSAGKPWKIALIASWIALASVIVVTGASATALFICSSVVMLGYVVLGTRKIWKF